jgi:hypothetical protein
MRQSSSSCYTSQSRYYIFLLFGFFFAHKIYAANFVITISTTLKPQTGDINPVLNIAEIKFFRNNGSQILRSQFSFTATSIYSSGGITYPPSNANDNNLNTIYHSNFNTDPLPVLTITTLDTNLFNQIVVYNRVDCCQTRIQGAIVKIFLSADLVNPIWQVFL